MTGVAVTDRCLGCVDIPDPFWVVAIVMGFPGGSDSKKSACNAEDLGLAWRIPWTEMPGRLQSTGSQRVKHN